MMVCGLLTLPVSSLSDRTLSAHTFLSRTILAPTSLACTLLACVLPSWGSSVHAQAPPAVRDVVLSADTAEIGDPVDLRFTLVVPDEAVAFFPDSLPSGPVESVRPVEWSVVDTVGGAIRLSVVYPLIVFETGSSRTPELDVFVAPAEESVAAGLSAPGERVGSWSSFREAPSVVPSARLLPVPSRDLRVASVLALDDLTTQITPRPPADVSGGSRDWASTTLVAVFGLLLLGLATISAREWVEARGAEPPSPPPSARERALHALDELEAGGLHRQGHVREFYAAWSDIVRRYVEGFAEEWGPAWTSTELIADLQGRRRGLAIERALSAEAVSREMRMAEEVKFGGRRPDAETAEAHLRRVRDWIASSRLPESLPGEPRPGGEGAP